MGLAPGAGPRLQYEDPHYKLQFARLVTHYWSNGAFLGETELMDECPRLHGIPGVLVHGRYDVSSPIETPWRLSKHGAPQSWSLSTTPGTAAAR